MLALLVNWVVTALLFLVLARLPIGVRVDGFGAALLAALVFGAINTFLKPLLTLLTLPFTVLTLGLFLVVINAALFALAAALVPGFRLTHGFLSAVLGSIALSLLSWFVQLVFWPRLAGV